MLLHLNKPVDDYLVDLRDKLDAVAHLGTSHANRAQQNYGDRYNLRARDKHFKELTLLLFWRQIMPVNFVHVGSDL